MPGEILSYPWGFLSQEESFCPAGIMSVSIRDSYLFIYLFIIMNKQITSVPI